MSLPTHGNYHGYYLKRPSITDPRLALLPEDIFQGKRVLDIGCNEGWVTCEIAQAWGAHKVVGVDIDDMLIRAAWKRRQMVWSLQKPDIQQSDNGDSMDIDDPAQGYGRSKSDYFPASLQHSFGPLPIPSSSSERRGKQVFPHNVSFRTEDFTKGSDSSIGEEYDVVLAFSLSKWIHVNNGDDGLRKFFERVHSVLGPGGVFILEPQEWETYKKVKRMNESLRSKVQSLKLRPRDFDSILQEVGFSPAQHVGATGEGGFHRAVDLYVKHNA